MILGRAMMALGVEFYQLSPAKIVNREGAG